MTGGHTMPEEKSEGEEQTNLPQRVESVTTWVARMIGGIYSAHDPVTGTLVGVEADNIGKTARAIVETTQQRVGALRVWRVMDGWARTRKAIDDRGTEPDPEQVADLIIEADQVFADAATEKKRQIVANLIANAAGCKGFAKRAEAMHALGILQQMKDDAVIVFGFIASDLGNERQIDLPHGLPYHDLPWVIVVPALRRELAQRWQLVSEDLASHDASGRQIYRCVLAPLGEWLRDWIKTHPASVSDGREGS